MSLVVADDAVLDRGVARCCYAATLWSGAVLDDESVDEYGIAVPCIDQPLHMVTIQDAGMSFEISERQIVIKWLIAIEPSINMIVAKYI